MIFNGNADDQPRECTIEGNIGGWTAGRTLIENWRSNYSLVVPSQSASAAKRVRCLVLRLFVELTRVGQGI